MLPETETSEVPAQASSCPRCNGPLRAADVHPHGLLGCLSCGGVFLSHSAVSAVISRSEGHAALEAFSARVANVAHAPPPRDGPAGCPICAGAMTQVKVRDITVHTCNAHGSWFEAGDVERLQHLPVAAHGANAAPQALGPMSARSPVEDPLPNLAVYAAANLASRLAAQIIDSLFFLPAFVLSFILLATDAPPALVLMLGVGAIVASVCIQMYWAATRGQTFGKKQARIRVVRVDGSPVGAFRILILRNFVPYYLIPWAVGAAWQVLRTASETPSGGGFFLPAEPALWPLSLLFSQLGILLVFLPQRRAVHDYVAGTIVVSAA
jgi:uncharacterized RDD family membrane protein YckC/Zn-finger nucleic acid-binding protein